MIAGGCRGSAHWLGLQGAAGVGPPERFGEDLVDVIDELQKTITQGLHRRDVAATDDRPRDHGEDPVDLVQPGGGLSTMAR